MKFLTAGLLTLVLCAAVVAEEPAATQPAASQPAEQSELKTYKEKSLYAIGLSIGSGFRQNMVEVDVEKLARGIKDAMAGAKPLLTDAELRDVIEKFQQEMTSRKEEAGAKQLAEIKKQGDKNKVDGPAFLDKNKKEAGVTTTTSGLQYKVLTEGKGNRPKPTDSVTLNYKGTLIDGTEFANSYAVKQPATCTVNDPGLIAGWTEALQLMPVGSKFQVVIPANLAYGEAPNGPGGPNAVLIFEIELLKINAPAVDAPAGPASPPMVP